SAAGHGIPSLRTPRSVQRKDPRSMAATWQRPASLVGAALLVLSFQGCSAPPRAPGGGDGPREQGKNVSAPSPVGPNEQPGEKTSPPAGLGTAADTAREGGENDRGVWDALGVGSFREILATGWEKFSPDLDLGREDFRRYYAWPNLGWVAVGV